MSDEATLPLPEPPKKRVRASIADTVAIGKALEDNVIAIVEGPDDIKHGYVRSWTDERVAREYVPHLAAHHVAAVREALYPKWVKQPIEMSVEDRLAELEKVMHLEFEARLGALEKATYNEFAGLSHRIDALERAALTPMPTVHIDGEQP